MIQCGDPDSKEASKVDVYGEKDAGYTLPAEILPQYYHKKGMLAAARESDSLNVNRESSGSQFYITVGKVQTDSTLAVAKERIAKSGGSPLTEDRIQVYKTEGGVPHLDGSYTIFGEVISGIKVAEKISLTPTSKEYDRPKNDVFIKSIKVTLVEDK